MKIICLDLEGVLIPEIWREIAKKTKIEDLKLTTRDLPDYDFLMKRRLKILRENNIKLKDIQKIIKKMKPFKGAINFLNWLRKNFLVIILTDSFYQFINPLREKLFYLPIFCNQLKIDKAGFIKNYQLRLKGGKKEAIKLLKALGFEIIAIGDSYNDLEMLKEADFGLLFNPPKNIIKKNLKFEIVKNYQDLKFKLKSVIKK
ncbi:MAG: bifunctional phosphoserine phosphatase/homoserine phosphotransferase ThrH [Patescibacteria group bacterium]|nr:bifunctional phosphoserine phosphatase/homoserine phosphotransferase ThrH [Patescibacteria group bacterium]